MKTKLISLRGNSGSGKSTISALLKDRLADCNILYIEQDMVRMYIIKAIKDENEKPRRRELMINLMLDMIEWGSKNVDVIILEGIFSAKSYTGFYEQLLTKEIDFLPYYFDLSFEETLIRHATRDKSKLFGAEEMKDWFNPHDAMPKLKEKIINETMTKEEILSMILQDLGL